jgi:hypothetical protein
MLSTKMKRELKHWAEVRDRSLFLFDPARLRIDIDVQDFVLIDVKDKPIEHLVDGLRPVLDSRLGVGVVRVKRRVVEVSDGLDGRPLGIELRAGCDFVAELPFEVVIRDLQERLLRTLA